MEIAIIKKETTGAGNSFVDLEATIDRLLSMRAKFENTVNRKMKNKYKRNTYRWKEEAMYHT